MNFNNYSKVAVWELLSILPPSVVLAINDAHYNYIWKFLFLTEQKQKCGVVKKENSHFYKNMLKLELNNLIKLRKKDLIIDKVLADKGHNNSVIKFILFSWSNT